MKQPTLTNIISAFADEPKAIAERLALLGLEKQDFAKNLSEEILNTSVYGTSFLKFVLQNVQKLGIEDKMEPQEIPADFKNSFTTEQMTIGERLDALKIENLDGDKMFPEDLLNLSVNGDEFQDFLLANQTTFVGKIGQLAEQGGKDNG